MNLIMVAIDLETTGLNARTDRIIEVAAVRFEGRKVLDTFSSVANPRVSVPYRVKILTGIDPAEVEKAPPLESVLREFVAFVGDCPVVGHNVPFDLAFLAQAGVHLPNQVYDTFEMASLLVRMDDYTLANLSKRLGLSIPTHRALPDALATAGLFAALHDVARRLDPGVCMEVDRLGEIIDRWQLRPIFSEMAGLSSPSTTYVLNMKAPVEAPEPLKASPQVQSLDSDILARSLEPGGSLAARFCDFEYRPQQVKMMRAVAQALSSGEHLLVEAGTGTGKSIAYLLPAIRFALQNNAQVVISTNTVNLQEQLVNKDIPGLLECLGEEAAGLKYVSLKGRGNYLCLRRWQMMRQSSSLSPEEAHLLIRLGIWLASTRGGDRAELNLMQGEDMLWGRVCAQPGGCLGVRCQFHDQACFLYQVRHQAQAAHLVIVNHALLLSDLASGSNVLPQYKHLIVDESHQLEAEASEQFGYLITQRLVGDYLNRLKPASGASGLLPRVRNLAGAHSPAGEQSEALQGRVDSARRCFGYFFDSMARLVSESTPSGGDYERTLSLTPEIRANPRWTQVRQAYDDLALSFHDLQTGLGKLRNALQDSPDFTGRDDLGAELASLDEHGSQLAEKVSGVIALPDENMIYWAKLNVQERAVTLGAAPLEVGSILQEKLFSQQSSVVLTSATLTAENTFSYVKERLGLEKPAEVMVESPFDYLSSTLIYLPQDVPEPDKPGYQASVEQALVDISRAAEGRTLVLFTSHAALRGAQAAIAPILEKDNILVLGQGVDGSPKQLLNIFKKSPRTVLLGTASLWEGIDVPGDALSVLVMMRLPFNVPNDPIFSARSKMYEDPFNQYSLPQAVLRFKQGFGRLIRTKRDRGVMVVLDRRVTSKYYGRTFIESLPVCTVKQGALRFVSREVSGWLSLKPERSGNCLHSVG